MRRFNKPCSQRAQCTIMKNKTCLVIVGPTAVGKTSLAIAVSQTFSTHKLFLPIAASAIKNLILALLNLLPAITRSEALFH